MATSLEPPTGVSTDTETLAAAGSLLQMKPTEQASVQRPQTAANTTDENSQLSAAATSLLNMGVDEAEEEEEEEEGIRIHPASRPRRTLAERTRVPRYVDPEDLEDADVKVPMFPYVPSGTHLHDPSEPENSQRARRSNIPDFLGAIARLI